MSSEGNCSATGKYARIRSAKTAMRKEVCME